MIDPPRTPPGHPNRGAECKFALKPEVSALLNRGYFPGELEMIALRDRARAAGWTSAEITTAVSALNQKFGKSREIGR
jgi:hypothetical protein